MIKWIKETDTWEHIPYTPEEEAFWSERARFDAGCREAQALWSAGQKVKLEIAKRLLEDGYSIEEIIRAY